MLSPGGHALTRLAPPKFERINPGEFSAVPSSLENKPDNPMKLSPSVLNQLPVSAPQRFLTVIGFALASLFTAAETNASTKVTFGGDGHFVVIAPDNPFGAASDGNLYFDLSFSFILPSNADDLLPADPDNAQWTTSANASITANGVTINFAGPAIINLHAQVSGVGPIAAAFLFPGLSVSFASYDDELVFPDDGAEHLLELDAADNPLSGSYVTVNSPLGDTYNDLNKIYLVSVEKLPDHSVPEGSSTSLLVALGAVFLAATRHMIRRRARQANGSA